jgi:hypothetical protein
MQTMKVHAIFFGAGIHVHAVAGLIDHRSRYDPDRRIGIVAIAMRIKNLDIAAGDRGDLSCSIYKTSVPQRF